MQLRKVSILSSVFSVLFVLLLSSLSFASTPAQIDSIATEKSAEIYVSGSAIIKGVENFSNASIVSIETLENKTSNSKVKTLAKTEDQSISAQIIRKEKEAAQKIAKLQKQIKETATVFITKNPASSYFNNSSSQNGSIAVVSSTSIIKFLKDISRLAISQHCKEDIKKQKYYTTLSYLQFGKYRNSSLRAPPVQS